MNSKHKIIFQNSEKLNYINNESIDLIVTSPPYPMIEMWDDLFSNWDNSIKNDLLSYDGNAAFEKMHQLLDTVWNECTRVVRPCGFVCINIGDATRNIGEQFKLYSNHSRITNKFNQLGFNSLPIILWRKQTNSPNKFMGSGMLPSGAYVTLEHEYILIFRKGNKRIFNNDERNKRQDSAFFWEERNIWFSDLWDFKGICQEIQSELTRKRSAAYPIELAHRLINMYSLKGDNVLDPFLGTGTTLNACILNNRNCIGYEIDESMREIILSGAAAFKESVNRIIQNRYMSHIDFIKNYMERKGPTKYINNNHNFNVVTKQEINMKLEALTGYSVSDNDISCSYSTFKGDNSFHEVLKENKKGEQLGLFTA